MLVNGQSLREILLWEDTAPSVVEIQMQWEMSAKRSLRVWNCWERNGVINAWVGNAGMRVEAGPDGITILRCSDGEGEPNFGDLVARLETH